RRRGGGGELLPRGGRAGAHLPRPGRRRGGGRLVSFLSGLWTVASIELRQRVRGVAWYVLLGVFFLLVLLVTAVAMAALSWQEDTGGALYSVVIYFVLL